MVGKEAKFRSKGMFNKMNLNFNLAIQIYFLLQKLQNNMYDMFILYIFIY